MKRIARNGLGVVILLFIFIASAVQGPSPPSWWLLLFFLMVGLLDTIVYRELSLLITGAVLSSGVLLLRLVERLSVLSEAGSEIQIAMVEATRGVTMFVIVFTVVMLVMALVYFERNRAKSLPVLSRFPQLRTKKAKGNRDGKHVLPDVYLCNDLQGKPIYIPGKDRYLHTLLIGSTGSGKTSTVLAPMVWQDLKSYREGNRTGIIVIAPDAEFITQIKDWAIKLDLPYRIIDLDDPNSHIFNPLEGNPTIVSEIMRTVLRSIFGEQEAFFSLAQEMHAKNTILLMKKLRGDALQLPEVYSYLNDLTGMKELVREYKHRFGTDILTEYFEKEAFGKHADKVHQFAMGLRFQISDLLTNDMVHRVIVGKSEINLDEIMAEGGILLCNTALGKMGRLSRVFGQFLLMHVQNAVFRRPGNEFDRIPVNLYVDEMPVYFNPEFQKLLNLSRKYRCANVFTIQGPAQLEIDRQGTSNREIILNGCRNKIVIGVESARDAKLLSDSFGEVEEVQRRRLIKPLSVVPESFSETEVMKARFDYTRIMELEPWHGIIKTVANGKNQEPVEGIFEKPWDFLAKVERDLERMTLHRHEVDWSEVADAT